MRRQPIPTLLDIGQTTRCHGPDTRNPAAREERESDPLTHGADDVGPPPEHRCECEQADGEHDDRSSLA